MRIYLLLVVATLVAGCAQQSPFLHSAEEQEFNGMTVVVLAPDVTVNELGIASLEEVPEWTEQASINIDTYLSDLVKTASSTFEITKVEKFPEAKQDYLDEHLALYERLSVEFVSTYQQPAWKHHKDNIKMSIGNGLAEIKKELNADAVLVVIGDESVSSGGRVVSAVLMAAAFGVAMPMGHALIHVGLIDLETGEIIWTNTTYNPGGGLRTDREARLMMDRALQGFSAELPPKPKTRQQLTQEKIEQEKEAKKRLREERKMKNEEAA